MTRRARHSRNSAWLAWWLIPAGVLLFAVANAHLVYVAVQSQPDCVQHMKAASEGNGYHAAGSAC